MYKCQHCKLEYSLDNSARACCAHERLTNLDVINDLEKQQATAGNVGIVRPMPPVQFEAVTINTNHYHCPIGGEQISVASLIVMAEDLPEFDLDISGVHIGCEPFGDTRLTPYDLAHHCIRVGAVDITKPVIMNLDGYIMDGWHRVVRALLDGRTHIPAKRFTVQKTFHKAE